MLRFLSILPLLLVLCFSAPLAFAADEHGHIGHKDEGPKVNDPVDVKSDLAFFTAVVFILLMLILGKFAWGPIIDGLDKREAGIKHHIDEAGRKHEEAKQLLAQYEAKLAAATDTIRGLMEEAHRDAEQVKAGILAEAKAAADAERARSLREIDAATDASLKQLAELSANLAVDLAGKIVSAKLSKEDHSRLIQEAVNRLPKSSLN